MVFTGISLGIIFILWAAGLLPKGVMMMYAIASLAAFAAYATDKAAAQNGSRRLSEKSMHFISVMGGWPGAYLGQQMFRHKTQKKSFQIIFWITVILNCAGIGWLYLRPHLL